MKLKIKLKNVVPSKIFYFYNSFHEIYHTHWKEKYVFKMFKKFLTSIYF